MVIGLYETKVTGKRRLAIPKKFREKLGSTLIVAKWYEKCLVLTGEEGWDDLFKRVTGDIKMITSPVRDTDRFILGSAYEVNPDDQGRVVLPEKLINWAGIKSEAVFLGLGDRVEIWDKAEWEKKEKQIGETAEELLEKLGEYAQGSTTK